MFKRSENCADNNFSVPAKRPKYETKKQHAVSTVKEDLTNKKIKSDDLWGDDFAEADIEEMDIVASQACLQEDNSFNQSSVQQDKSFMERFDSIPSTSKSIYNLINNDREDRKSPMQKQQPDILRRKIDISKESMNLMSQINYKDFKSKLINKKEYNSTFQLEDEVVVSENTYIAELEKLKLENKKLLNDFITKDGEVVFLRNQLQQTQLRAEYDKLEKTRFMEAQIEQHRSEMNAICKEKEYLKTQLELQAFEVGNLAERYKLLEVGNVRLTEPHSVNVNFSTNKVRGNSTTNRLSSFSKPLKVREIAVQTNVNNQSTYLLKTWGPYYPLAGIPKSLFVRSQPEKSIVDIQITEKTGKRNLPILQEEESSRIFENPELVKPVTTIIDGKKLTTEFILPEIAVLQRKMDTELELESSIPIINKLVATARELILNVIVVLQGISHAMRNDDIRDMNDIYFSELYSNSDIDMKSVCDTNAWHECERGVEARRVFGALSYINSESIYLSKYIAGKTSLLTEKDEAYKCYTKQMVRYNSWPEKDCEFEMLNIILQFVTLVGSTRRSHQFSGLMCAIAMVIYNAHKKIGYCSRGMEYVFQIFREIVFSRPLTHCYVVLTNLMTVFVKSPTHLRKLCVNSQSMAVKNWKGALHFTSDACPLQIFLAQMESYRSDIIVTIETTDALLLFVQYILQTNVIPLRPESSESCNCCMKVLRFTIKMLCKCSEVNLSAIGKDNGRNLSTFVLGDSCSLKQVCGKHSMCHIERNSDQKCLCEVYRERFSDMNSWRAMQRKQMKVLKNGIRFLGHLAICDPDFVIRLSDIEDSFHLFMRNISTFDDLIVCENEREAMNRIQRTFILDKTPQCDDQLYSRSNIAKQLNMLSNFEQRLVQPATEDLKDSNNYSKTLTMMKALFNSKTGLSD